jgi:hypothetical protein
MSDLQIHLVGTGEDSTLSVFIPGERPINVTGTHPNFDEILDEARSDFPDTEAIIDLADPSITVEKYLTPLSERVRVSGGQVFFDGEAIKSAITDQIVRLLEEDEGTGDNSWRALVAFLEKLAQNPILHSQHRLYGWLAARDFTITQDGDIVAYKGCTRDGAGTLRSLHSGPGIVNGQPVNECLDNTPGTVVEIERSYVEHDPATGCSTGLHAGTFDYAEGYSRNGAVLSVLVNPRDVVSVPTDSGDQKLRVCRYRVVEVVSEAFTAPVVFADEYSFGD